LNAAEELIRSREAWYDREVQAPSFRTEAKPDVLLSDTVPERPL
jgi:hypothetical protein